VHSPKTYCMGGSLPRVSMESHLHQPAPPRRRWPVAQPGLVQVAGPSSPEASMYGKEPSIACRGSAAKFQGGAREIPASCQDWCGLLLYSLGYPARGSRGQSMGGAWCVASTRLAGTQVTGPWVGRGQCGQHRRGMGMQWIVVGVGLHVADGETSRL